MCSNTAVKCTTPFKYTKTVTTNIFKNNYTASADAGAISADISAVELSKGKSYKLNTRTYPVNSDASDVYKLESRGRYRGRGRLYLRRG
ncbi:MAG: hypothetical protein IJ903_01975 [Ruminococcus sp.]|nr:hypothetical protein [Ruminococcus sp.]